MALAKAGPAKNRLKLFRLINTINLILFFLAPGKTIQ